MASTTDKSPYITTGERVRSFLAWAFVISVLGHLIFGPFIPFQQTHTEDQQTEKVSVEKKVKIKPPPTPPPPTPTPKPTPQPKVTPQPKPQKVQPKLAVQPPKTTSNTAGGSNESKYVPPPNGSQNGVPSGSGTSAPAGSGRTGPVAASTPTPAPTPTRPACATPFKDATMVNQAELVFPEAAKEVVTQPTTVMVQVDLTASGTVAGTAILSDPAGNGQIERAAMAAARQSTYSPKVVNCTPVAGSYSFRAEFNPGE